MFVCYLQLLLLVIACYSHAPLFLMYNQYTQAWLLLTCDDSVVSDIPNTFWSHCYSLSPTNDSQTTRSIRHPVKLFGKPTGKEQPLALPKNNCFFSMFFSLKLVTAIEQQQAVGCPLNNGSLVPKQRQPPGIRTLNPEVASRPQGSWAAAAAAMAPKPSNRTVGRGDLRWLRWECGHAY